jgi:hypothetical protein
MPEPRLGSALPMPSSLIEREGAVTAVRAHVDDRGLCVLCDVGDRLGRDVITGRLDVITKPRAEIEFDFNRHRRAPGECLKSRA